MNLHKPLVLVFAIIFFLFVIIVLCGQSAKEPFASLEPIHKNFFSDTNDTLGSLKSDIESMKASLENTETSLAGFRMKLQEMDANTISPEFQSDINALVGNTIDRGMVRLEASIRRDVTEKTNKMNKDISNLRYALENNVVMYENSDYTTLDMPVNRNDRRM
jgi:hypothetical protein